MPTEAETEAALAAHRQRREEYQRGWCAMVRPDGAERVAMHAALTAAERARTQISASGRAQGNADQ